MVVASGIFLFNPVAAQAVDDLNTLDQQLLELQQQMQIQQQNTAAQISALEKRLNESEQPRYFTCVQKMKKGNMNIKLNVNDLLKGR